MKKIVINLLAISLIGVSVAACSSGSTSSGTPAPAAPVVNPVVVPAEFVPFGSTNGVSSSTTSLAYNESAGAIAVPVNGTYQTYALPSTVNTALSTAFTDGVQNEVLVSVSGSNVILQVPSTTLGAEPTIYVLTPVGQVAPSTIAIGGTNAEQAPIVQVVLTDIPTESAGIQSTQFSLPSGMMPSTGIVVNPDIPVTQKTNLGGGLSASLYLALPLTGSGGCTGYTGVPSALQIANYAGTVYAGVGSTTGQVCVLTIVKPDVLQSRWTSLTSGPNTAEITSRYVPGNVNQFNFYQGNSAALFGYWNVNSAGTNQIYRVTSATSSISTPSSFWNITTAAPQTSSTFASSVTFSNVPTSVNSMYTDNNGNVYVGTANGGSVYKLAAGITQWTSSQLNANQTGAVTVSPTTTGSGAIATVINPSTGQVAVYTVY